MRYFFFLTFVGDGGLALCMEVRSATENVTQDSLTYKGKISDLQTGHPCKGKPCPESRTYTMHAHTVLTCSDSRIISNTE